MSDDGFHDLLSAVVAGRTLDAEQSARAFAAIMAGGVDKSDLAAFLTAQARRGPTVEEIVGATRVLRGTMRSIAAPAGAIDLCGTGGDGHGTLNISTAVSFVVAGCGVAVAKHGNRNMSSKTGAADVLEALGVRIDIAPPLAERCLREARVCFLFAQIYHPAMRHVAQVRRELGFRTIFNLLGPLSNPAGVRRQLLGVYAADWLEPLARVLAELGTEKAWIVHGRDGMDELTTTAASAAAMLDQGRIASVQITPEDAGLERGMLAALKGGDAGENAAAIHRLLAGEKSPYRDIVLLNAAAALVVADAATDLRQGVEMAAQSIDGGAATRALDALVAVSQAQAA